MNAQGRAGGTVYSGLTRDDRMELCQRFIAHDIEGDSVLRGSAELHRPEMVFIGVPHVPAAKAGLVGNRAAVCKRVSEEQAAARFAQGVLRTAVPAGARSFPCIHRCVAGRPSGKGLMLCQKRGGVVCACRRGRNKEQTREKYSDKTHSTPRSEEGRGPADVRLIRHRGLKPGGRVW